MAFSFDLSYLTFVATQAALKAGEILRKGFGTSYQIQLKSGRQNFVTEFDKASEACIISFIKEHFPTHIFLAEESGLSAQVGAETILWIIDPLDGTTNFAHHIPLFSISIAAYYKEECLCGVIFQPLTHELFISEKGKGAYLNGERLSVSTTDRIENALIGAGFPYDVKDHPTLCIEQLAQLTQLGATLRNLGSASLALAYVAAGKLDGFWMNNLYIWDWAAGQLLIQEAQGKITYYDRQARQLTSTTSLLATNSPLHEPLLKYLTHPSI
ncbi:inositol monophosphatase family protein [Candidatus Protochlamydia phocaeensis]|uniref:inositol monophosphatase family protein n=1 Tax=Candidatus Protochlamydia phocaeensis TaxID=1414722 RepID=UPI0008392CD9|nr:inositol monophosphatase family protein [Candidatus Protochlamydia phocaeensis]